MASLHQDTPYGDCMAAAFDAHDAYGVPGCVSHADPLARPASSISIDVVCGGVGGAADACLVNYHKHTDLPMWAMDVPPVAPLVPAAEGAAVHLAGSYGAGGVSFCGAALQWLPTRGQAGVADHRDVQRQARRGGRARGEAARARRAASVRSDALRASSEPHAHVLGIVGQGNGGGARYGRKNNAKACVVGSTHQKCAGRSHGGETSRRRASRKVAGGGGWWWARPLHSWKWLDDADGPRNAGAHRRRCG